MKRQFSILLHILLLLALSACGIIPASSPMPNPTATTQPTRLPSRPSREVATPDVVDTWSPPLPAASITPLSCDEIGKVFAYDPQVPLDKLRDRAEVVTNRGHNIRSQERINLLDEMQMTLCSKLCITQQDVRRFLA